MKANGVFLLHFKYKQLQLLTINKSTTKASLRVRHLGILSTVSLNVYIFLLDLNLNKFILKYSLIQLKNGTFCHGYIPCGIEWCNV